MTKNFVERLKIDLVVKIVAVAAVLYTLLTTYSRIHTATEYVNTHLLLVFLLIGLDSLRRWPKCWPVWALFIVAAIASCVYVNINLDGLEMRSGYPTEPDMVVGVALILLASYACYWAFGWVVACMIPISLAYALFGYLIPGFFNTFQPDLHRLVSALSIGLSGVYGPLLSASANYIFLFIVLGAFIMITPADLAFTEISKLVVGRTRGGTGHMPVVSSAIVGMITGASSANIAITGAITIPPMKEAGYNADEAGAIEAVASHGGQIMPPVLGASAFVMAELTGIDYFDICVACVIPAIIYFLSISMYVELRARKLNMRPTKVAIDMPKLLLGLPFVVVPIGLLIVLMVLDYSPNYAAFWTLMATMAVTFLSKKTRPSFPKLVDALTEGAMIGAMMTGVTAGLGMMMTVMSSTGLSIKLPEFIEVVSAGNVWIGMFFLFIMSLLLGSGLPTLAVYLVLAIVTAPVLVGMGASVMAVHLSILYFANYAGVTPPFAPGAMIAAKLADGNWVRTTNLSMLIGIPALFLPFLWISNPVLLWDFSDPLLAAMTLTACALSVLLLNMMITRYLLVDLDTPQMVLTLIAAIGLCVAVAMKSYLIFGATLIPMAIVLLQQMRESNRVKVAAPTAA